MSYFLQIIPKEQKGGSYMEYQNIDSFKIENGNVVISLENFEQLLRESRMLQDEAEINLSWPKKKRYCCTTSQSKSKWSYTAYPIQAEAMCVAWAFSHGESGNMSKGSCED